MTNKVVLGAAILRRNLQGRSFDNLKDVVSTVMEKAQNPRILWFGNEDEKFRCAVGAIGMLAKPEDKPRLEHEIKMMRILGLVLCGKDVDMSEIVMNAYEPVGLQKCWDDLKKGGPDA